jgi:hypothetical protein
MIVQPSPAASRTTYIRARLNALHAVAMTTMDAHEFESACSAIALLSGVLPELDARARKERRAAMAARVDAVVMAAEAVML